MEQAIVTQGVASIFPLVWFHILVMRFLNKPAHLPIKDGDSSQRRNPRAKARPIGLYRPISGEDEAKPSIVRATAKNCKREATTLSQKRRRYTGQDFCRKVKIAYFSTDHRYEFMKTSSRFELIREGRLIRGNIGKHRFESSTNDAKPTISAAY